MAKPAGKVPDHLRSEISLRVHPQDWLAKARKLKKAADLLFRNFEIEQVKFDEEFEKDCDTDLPRPDDTVVTMLLGFAVENLLKGLHVSTLKHVNLERVKDLCELKFPGKGHELVPLARAVKLKLQIEFSLEEFNLLDALEREVLWSGRYPSALNIDRSIPIDENGYFKKFFFDYPNDHFATIKLYDRLETILQNQASARPPETSQ